ncbi:DNA/RNA helicase domain-containing protein [Paenibacillus sp. 2TAB26]|uniref:DNA/RNA helicase domain-containing protein n=1 Tax=Paenibacillus sp. 2TAB26 TaxID=3233005 RepID=UPI003F9881F9
MNYGWAGTIHEFLKLDKNQFLNKLDSHIYRGTNNINEQECLKRDAQGRAWEDTFHKLQLILKQYELHNFSIIFEYEILRGGGRRPDVIIIANGHVIVVECKSFDEISPSEYIQTSLYVRDLENYHSEIHRTNTPVKGAILLTNHPADELLSNYKYRVYISTTKSLYILLDKIIGRSHSSTFDMHQFTHGEYEPSPSILEAARAIYHNEPLPNIRAMASSNFTEVQQTVRDIITEAQETNTHHLVLVSGEPGAGKTYLGLDLAHNVDRSVYLSGNGPLVDVLQDTLKNKSFVQGLYPYKMDFLEKGTVPKEQIIIFDEAQRAWDADKVNQSLIKKNRAPMHLSEPDIMVQISTLNKTWSVTVGLIGEGQEIYSGEEGGLELWNTAIANKNIIVHAKSHESTFSNAYEFREYSHLHLNCSLRTHAALQYYDIINNILALQLYQAESLVKQLAEDRYFLIITRDLNTAKSIASQLYADDTKTVGIICSSGADEQKEVPVIPRNDRYETPSKIAQYFNYPESKFYCKKLQYSTTEFHTQGLELDMSIVHWDDDLYFKNNMWYAQHFQWGVKDQHQIKLNAYRVILTRGRDGTIIYIPPRTILDATFEMLTQTVGIPHI